MVSSYFPILLTNPNHIHTQQTYTHAHTFFFFHKWHPYPSSFSSFLNHASNNEQNQLASSSKHIQNSFHSHYLQTGLPAFPWTQYSQTQVKSVLSSKPSCLPLSLREEAKILTLPYRALHCLSDLQLC